jgi:hypothetical protein
VGCSFANLHIRSSLVSQVGTVSRALQLAPFAIAATGEEWTTVCPRDLSYAGAETAQRVSERLEATVLLFWAHDSDVFGYERYDAGRKTDEYVSDPHWVDEDLSDDEPPRGGELDRLRALCLPGTPPQALARLLRQRCAHDLSDAQLHELQNAELERHLEQARARYEERKHKASSLSLESVLESARRDFWPSIELEAACREDLAERLGRLLGIDPEAAIASYAAVVEDWDPESPVKWERVSA